MYDDVSPIQFLVYPAVLEDVFAREEEAETEGEGDEKDAGAGVGASSFGRPGWRIERGGGRCVEERVHAGHWG